MQPYIGVVHKVAHVHVLIQRNSAVGDIAVHLGYADDTQFVRAFKRANGITPLQWKKANQP